MIRSWLDYSFIVLAGLLYAIALKYFVLPSRVILTGTEGIATALSYYFESYSLFVALYVVFQIVLLAFGFARVSKVFAVRSLAVVATVILALLLLPDFRFAQPEPQNERIILVLFGGLLAGVAKAIAFTNRGSTGDEDILGAYFATKYLKPVGSISIIAAIVSTTFGLAMELFKHGDFEAVINTLMYTCIYIFASAETLNNLYHKFKVMILVVFTCHEKMVGQAILAAAPHRTYTVHPGTGGRSGNTFSIVRAIITREELRRVIEEVQTCDPESFYYHHDVEGVSGNYYITPIG